MTTLTIQTKRIQQMNEKKNKTPKQKTPIITGLYVLLTIIFITLGVSTFGLFLLTSFGLVFVIYSIYKATKFKHDTAIKSGLIGQVINIFVLNSFYVSLPSSDTNLNMLFFSVIISIMVIICLLEIFIIYPLLYMYRKEEKSISEKAITPLMSRFQQGKMEQDQAIAYIKELSTVYDSIVLDVISEKINWEVKELTQLIESLIFNGELTAKISDDKLIFDREALIALKETSELKNTELDEVEAETTPEEILPIKDKKGKTLKNVVSVDDIEKVLSVEEMKELQQTEAEIGIEEIKINCIVHKGPVEGTNVYICPKCKTFYCVRCAKAVKKSGENCWTCKSKLTL